MATNTAIIQHRRGSLDDFNPEKLTPGELAVITDERSVYMGFPGGEAEKIVLEKDFTSESIKEKLGYEPADEERVDQLFRDKADYQYVDKKVSNVKVDLTGYAKEDYVDDEIEELNKKIVQETGKLSQENAELKGDINSGKVGQESLVRSKMSYYNVVDTNLIGKENGYDFIDGYYYSPSAGYIAREGYRCIFMVPIKSNTTYYASCTSYVLFNANKNKTGNGDAPPSGIAQFTTGNNDKYITLNFSDSYTEPPVQGWFLSEVNGRQHRKVYDKELAISDDNFKDFGMNMSEIINKVRMSCKLVESVASIEDMIANVKISNGTKTGVIGKGNILNESRFIAGSSKTITEITKTLKQPIKGSDFESITVVLYLPYETLNAESSSGGYYQIYLNGNSQLGTYLNGRTTFGWNFVKLDRDEFPKLTDDTVITSIQLKLTPRNNVSIEGIFGESYLNALLFNLRVKPTVLLSFDQIWEESLNNGCYDMAYNREIPYSLYMIYDNLTQNEKNLIEKYKNFAEFSLYGSITGKNGFLWDDTGFPTMKSKLDLLERGIEYGESEVKQPFTTYAVSQTAISPLGYVALSHTNLKCARLIYDKLPVAYFDASNRLISSTGVDQKTGEYVNAIIDRAVKYGSIASIFLHGVRDDGNDNSIISGKGMDKSEYTIMLNHIRELRNNGKIQVMTYSDFVNACIN